MAKFIEYISNNIIEIASNNNPKDNLEDGLSNSLNEISSFMHKLGINNDIIDDISASLKIKFNDLVQKGASPEEAYEQTFESLSDILNSSIPNESSKNILNEEGNQYDLSFASSSMTDKSLLIDDAISQGMSVKEAIRYVNDQLNPSSSDGFGPPNFTDSVYNKSNHEMLTKSEDEMNLDKIEADMDEQANKLIGYKSEDKYSSSTEEVIVDKLNDKLEDDDTS